MEIEVIPEKLQLSEFRQPIQACSLLINNYQENPRVLSISIFTLSLQKP